MGRQGRVEELAGRSFTLGLQEQGGLLLQWRGPRGNPATGRRRDLPVNNGALRRLNPLSNVLYELGSQRERERSSESNGSLVWEKEVSEADFWAERKRNAKAVFWYHVPEFGEVHSQPAPVPWSHGYVSVCCMLCHLLSPTPNTRRRSNETWARLPRPLKTLHNILVAFQTDLCFHQKKAKAIRFFPPFSFIHRHISAYTAKTEGNITCLRENQEECLHAFFNSFLSPTRNILTSQKTVKT